MSRYIGAGLLKAIIDGGFDLDFDEMPETKKELLRMIDDVPSADVVEVRHGRWRDIGKTACQCSECDYLHLGDNAEWTTMLYKYCPNCGARMDGEKE